MTKTHPLAGLVAAVLCALATVSADAAESLSLSQAVGMALRSNPTIAAVQLSADAAKQSALGAGTLTNPEIIIAPSIVGDAGSDSVMTFSQPLELNGTRAVRGKIASNQATAAGFDAAATRRETVLQVKQIYWDVVCAQELVALNQENIAYLESLKTAVQKQLDVGTIPGSQLIKTDVELAGARQGLAQAQLGLAQSKASLNALLNRDMSTDFVATDALTFTDTAVDRASLLALALGSRPEVSAANALVGATRSEVQAAKLQRTPDVELQARKGAFEPDGDEGIAVAVVLPLLDWGSVKADVRRAERTAQSQEKQLEAIRNAISLEVQQSIQLVNTSAQVVREYQGGILEKSEQLADMAHTGYEKGATGYLEVLEAQRTLRNTKTAYYSALADHAKSIAQLDWASGAANDGATEVSK